MNVSRTRLLAVAVSMVAVVASAVAVTSTSAEAITSVSGVHLTAVDARLLADINHARVSAGVPALRVVASLTDSSQTWVMSEAARNAIGHSPSWTTRISQSGCPRWTAVAENTALATAPSGYSAAQAGDVVFGLYRSSAGHWANIMSRSYTEVGLATVDRIVVDSLGRVSSRMFNTIDFAAGCGTTSQRQLSWGVYQERVTALRGAVRDIDSFEARDTRPGAARWSSTMRSAVAWPAPTSGDDALRLTVANASTTASGMAGMGLHQGVDLRAATTLRVTIGVRDGVAQPVPLLVYSRQQWGGATARNGTDCPIGRLTVPTVKTTLLLRVPAACRYYANILTLRVSATWLASLSPSLSGRTATFYLYDIAVIG